MERLTKKDGANRNIIEVKKFSDDDWIIAENPKCMTISFHLKAVDKLAEFEDFMEEQGFGSLEDLKNTVGNIEKLMLISSKIPYLEQENQALKQQLAEWQDGTIVCKWTDAENKVKKLEKQLAEKETRLVELEKILEDTTWSWNNALNQLAEYSDINNALNSGLKDKCVSCEEEHNQDKIKFAIEQLEKVGQEFSMRVGITDNNMDLLNEIIDNQIEKLKKEKDNG